MLPPAPTGIPATNVKEDPRPIRDKEYQRQCISSLYKFLKENDYPNNISPKCLKSPSSRDFTLIVTFLLRIVDPNFQKFAKEDSLTPSQPMKLEDEICLAFKFCGYPYTLSKTALVMAGSPNSWPGLLAALTWLIEHIQRLQQIQPVDYLHRTDETAASGEPSFESVKDLEVRTERAFFQFLHEAYEAWMASDGEREARLHEQLVRQFDADNKVLDGETDRTADLNVAIIERMEQYREEIER